MFLLGFVCVDCSRSKVYKSEFAEWKLSKGDTRLTFVGTAVSSDRGLTFKYKVSWRLDETTHCHRTNILMFCALLMLKASGLWRARALGQRF
jgi:hypothetical protein